MSVRRNFKYICASAQSDQSLSFPPEETLVPWLPIEFVCLFCCFASQLNSFGHGGTVSSPNHTFFLGKLEQAVNQYFGHILSLVTYNNSSWMIQRKGGEWPQKLFCNQSPRKYGTGPGSNSQRWICSQTRTCSQTCYRLCYAARYST